MLTVVVTLSGAIQCSHSVWSKFAVTHCLFPGICLVSFFQKPLVPAQARHAFSLVWRQERRNLGCRHWPMLEGFIVKGSSMMAVVAVMWLSWLFRYSLCFLSCFLLRPVWQSTFYARVELAASPVTLCLCVLVDCQT